MGIMELQFHQKRHQRIGRWLILLLSRILLFLLTRRRVKGKENVPEQGRLLIVANHLSLADQYLLAISLNRKVIFMAKEEIFRSRVIRYLAHTFGAFPVRRGGIMDRKALQQANQVLDSGQALVMFPEGTRSKNAQLQPAFPGSALIALHNRIPILPVSITGTEKVKKGPFWMLLHRPRVMVNIGCPFHLPPVNGKLTKAELVELANYIMEHIAELLPPEYRGHYARCGD
ncbi:MAG: 1-acyl-sn-glycerol-3-phosphate acyltransferase [Dehalococcoidia bacterium]|nr:MAG: 1-acyl-sn-glycerol-3-phosphate acyltransferase [Dehalococcoidia bacterium]